MQNISVIIRLKNEDRWVGHTIQSILDNLDKPEIIIIDNNSNDKSIEIVNSFKEDPAIRNKSNKNYTNIKVININNYTPGKALNQGVKLSKKKNILVISSHCVLKKIKIKKHITDLKKYVAVFGNQTPIYEGKKIIKRYIWSHFEKNEVVNMYSKMENRYFFHNAIAMYERNTLVKYKFDENLTGKEDRYWADSIIKKKKKILYDPELEVDHHYTPNGNTWKGLA